MALTEKDIIEQTLFKNSFSRTKSAKELGISRVTLYNKKIGGFDRDAMAAMIEYVWPGNVRELEHVIERSVLMARGAQVRAEDLGLRGRPDGSARLEEMTLEDAEKYLIKKALGRSQGNVSRAAESLGLSRSALYRRLQQYGIEAE